MTTVELNHALPNLDGKPTYAYDGSFKELPPGVTQRRNGRSQMVPIDLHDGRALTPLPSLTKNGFVFADNFFPSIDLQNNELNSQEIIAKYYPQVSALVTEALGVASVRRATVFDHTIRSTARRERGEKETNGENVGGYANGAHNDNSSASAKARVRLLAKTKAQGGSVTLPEPPLTDEEAERIANGHFGIFNVWRHFRSDYPVQDCPLVVLDAATTRPSDFQIAQYIYPHRVGEVVNVLHQSRHQWIHYDQMRHDEALVFKIFDTASELGLSTIEACPPHTAHTSCRLPEANDLTPPRESIECRVLVEFNLTART
jgi:hypothetical protein